ncbi:hypothetical protein [Sporosarcina sp. FSL K6-1508]|uniref:hypothetical protein n=1 Tax=Sporosarcina sp. FSL K6-1508 TaxID=2921553 RepID=UPI0030FB81CB
MTKTTYIYLLTNNIQQAIEDELRETLSEQEIQLALSSRLCDLEETININKYINESIS